MYKRQFAALAEEIHLLKVTLKEGTTTRNVTEHRRLDIIVEEGGRHPYQ